MPVTTVIAVTSDMTEMLDRKGVAVKNRAEEERLKAAIEQTADGIAPL